MSGAPALERYERLRSVLRRLHSDLRDCDAIVLTNTREASVLASVGECAPELLATLPHVALEVFAGRGVSIVEAAMQRRADEGARGALGEAMIVSGASIMLLHKCHGNEDEVLIVICQRAVNLALSLVLIRQELTNVDRAL